MATFNEKLPEAIDLAHHLSDLSKRREQSPLKGLAKYFGQPGLISLAGGMPAPDYFPLASLSAETLVPDSFSVEPSSSQEKSNLSWLWKLFGPHKERTTHLVVPKYTAAPPSDEVSLAVALQYGTATGLLPLNAFITEFTKRVYQPQYADFTTLIHAGNTDGWSKAMQTLMNPGEMFLTEEWTYPSALATAKPHGVLPAPVKIDGEGMRADDLRKVLTEWDEKARGAPRPKLIYTVPVGQNPTGATMGATRKKDIYDICVEFDLLVVEDDPYYFLQQDAYVPKASRLSAPSSTSSSTKGDSDSDADAYIAKLAPSYLKFDYQGRVIRLDTFSKTIAPGSRLGWFTCNKLFAERLERQGECSTQAPCGFGQSFVAQLLTKQWGFGGYVRWLRGLRAEYTMRRDIFVDALCNEFAVSQSYAAQGVWAGCTAFVARPRPQLTSGRSNLEYADEKHAFGTKPLFSFVPPSAGMFVWLRIHFENHPAFTGEPADTAKLEEKLWTLIADAGVLIGPGTYFAATPDIQAASPLEGHFRIAFSNAEVETLQKAVRIMREVFTEFFQSE